LLVGDDGYARVLFDQPEKAVTPGQSAVFYLNEVCLGGGIIDSVIK
jgi:tRNA-specific 2-thiouridylase